jgi:RNA polymerase sigma-70 factor (ECF subfamily)
MRQERTSPLLNGVASRGHAVLTGTAPVSLKGEPLSPSAAARDEFPGPCPQDDPSGCSEDAVIQAALSGDEQAFEYLFIKYKADVFHVCLKYSNGDQDQANDLCQEAFISAFLKLARLRDRSRFIAWIAEIAKNKSLSFIRKRQADDRLLREYTVVKPAMSGHDSQWTDAELESIAALIRNVKSPALQETIRLFYIEGKRTAEIAQLQQISQTAVTTRLNRFRTKFKERITQEILSRRTFETVFCDQIRFQHAHATGDF